MQFALIYHYDPTTTGPSEDEVQAWIDLDAALRAEGRSVHEAGFHSRDEARTVVVRDGRTEVTKAATTPAAHTVAGYYVVTAADVEEAAELAARIPTAAYGYVEVRQVVEFTPE